MANTADARIDGVDYSNIDSSQRWRMLKSQKRFFFWCLWVSSGVIMQGFDIVAGGQLAALPEFQKQFGRLQPDGSHIIPAHYLSAWNSIAPACEIASTFIYAPLLEKYGRKPGILVASAISVAGVLLQQLATDWRVHLAGRGVNVPQCLEEAATLMANVAHIPAILASGWLFFPESPYWLVRQGKTTQAQDSLRRVYGFKDDAFYNVEVRRMETENNQALAIRSTFAQSSRRTFLGLDLSAEAECFDRMNRKRTLTAIFAASGQQMIGATFVIGYATYFLDLIGVKDYFDASIVLYVVMLLASMAAFPLTEIIGRRTMIVIPQFVLCCMLLLIGILGCVHDHGKASWGIIVFIYIWAIIYQLSIGAVGFVLASEIATVRLRSTTQGLVTITNAAWGLIMQFTIPYMINPDAGNLGGKVGFIFLGTGLIAAIGGWYLYPETKGISFEAMDELYASGTAPRHFSAVSEQQRGIPLESKTEPPVHMEDVSV
ncbi:putative MFS alpha-glucoside transporter [Aspergillus udagawae]|uniref:General alpha-glucoside permease n=1 Tax=Aspergillus udagawae TaxID=91492 RepID=A0A8E0R216_9EURO|nr:uncharacterized protein Aud_001934 [Aspergillus udagawae]GIC94605.1 hypothetical protein Aud_001934 [Aspergillus udagawae]